jgi:hypothetical protein
MTTNLDPAYGISDLSLSFLSVLQTIVDGLTANIPKVVRLKLWYGG